MQIIQNHRHFLAGAAAAGATGLLGTATDAWAEPPRKRRRSASRMDWRVLAGRHNSLLRTYCGQKASLMSGTWCRIGDKDLLQDTSVWMARGEIDFDWRFVPVNHRDDRSRHTDQESWSACTPGCLELMAHEGMSKGHRPEGQEGGGGSMALGGAHVPESPDDRLCWIGSQQRLRMGGKQGTRPEADRWSSSPRARSMLFLGSPPEPQELRARTVGHVIAQ